MIPKIKKKQAVLIEPLIYGYTEQGNPFISDISFFMWVDSKHIKGIKEVTGVTTVGDSEVIGRYLVMIDKRYDMQDIQDAIVQYVNFVELDNVIWSTNQTKEIG